MKAKFVICVFVSALLVACDDNAGTIASGSSPIPTSIPVNASQDVKQNAINTLVVDGKVIELVPKNSSLTIEGYYIADDRMIGTKLNNARFGYINNRPFSIGLLTDVSKMPKTGKAYYNGQAVFVVDGEFRKTSSYFEADFWNRKIEGNIGANMLPSSISQNQIRIIGVPLQATISGNSFKGTYRGVTVYGNFFGQSANEIAGYYENDNASTSGSFGATK